MRLLVARHGQTQFNQEYRMTGQYDEPLNALGLRQAEALAERLAQRHADALVSSDLLRARQTAEAIAGRMGQPIIFDAGLREIAMGAWEGRVYREVEREQRRLLEAVETDPTGQAGAPGGETWAQFSARVLSTLERWQALWPQGDVLWVAHGGVVSVLLLHALGLSFERRWQFARGNTALFEFEYRLADVHIVRVNDTSHLEQLRLEAGEAGEQEQAL